jgi:hypothetical protein
VLKPKNKKQVRVLRPRGRSPRRPIAREERERVHLVGGGAGMMEVFSDFSLLFWITF